VAVNPVLPGDPPAAPWQALPRGTFTGIDWSAASLTDSHDPYLAWAETDGFRGYQLPSCQGDVPSLPEWIPLILELKPGVNVSELVSVSDPGWLQVPPVYLRMRGLSYCTARARPGFFEALKQSGRLAQIVRRHELGLPVDHHTGPLSRSAHAPPSPDPVERLQGTVLGLIDGGLAIAHHDFLDPQGRPRVKHFWRQDGRYGSRWRGDQRPLLDPVRAGGTPSDLGYGHVLTGQQIQAAMSQYRRNGLVDEDALYQHLQLWDLNLLTSHGSHVMSQACAPRVHVDTIASEDRDPDFRHREDTASTCDLIAVQLDWSNVLDTSGGAMNVSVLDGLMYMLSRCADDARLIVNISWGTLAGPHDGSSILEEAMDQLIALRDGRLEIVVPAGNGYQSRTHANAALPAEGSLPLEWYVQPDDHSQSFLELWFGDPEGLEVPLVDLCVCVQPPGHSESLPPVYIGRSAVWPNAAAPQCALLFPRQTALGRHGTCALLALAPTASLQANMPTAPAGTWRVTVLNRGLNTVVVDAYIERDDVAMGTHTGARQSYFSDLAYDTSGDPRSFVDVPGSATPIRRSGSFNSLSTGRRTTSVGGVRHALGASDRFARYSPPIPDPDSARPQRPHVKKVPDDTAVTDDNAALWGIRGASSRSGGVVRLAGTSSASPQIAREHANAQPVTSAQAAA
jgi:hypothetical protein